MKFRVLNETADEYDKIFSNALSVLDEKYINEDKTVKFNNKSYPDYGYCVILCGGPGVGKSTAFDTLVSINARKYNADDIKDYNLKRSELNGDKLVFNDGSYWDLGAENVSEPYDMSNPEFTSFVHKHSKSLTNKLKDNILDMGRNASKGTLPNIVFDITGSELVDFQEIIDKVKPLGYKISIVWVLGSVEQAISQNNNRSRQVPIDVLLSKHSRVFNSVADFFSRKTMLSAIEEFWIILQTVYDVTDKNAVQHYINLPNVYQIKTKEDAIDLPNRVQGMVSRQRKFLRDKIINSEN